VGIPHRSIRPVVAQYRDTNARLTDFAAGTSLFARTKTIRLGTFRDGLERRSGGIARLSLLDQDRGARGRKLDRLDGNIVQGNSVVAGAFSAGRVEDAVPEVFQSCGFDVVIANPPYVRKSGSRRQAVPSQALQGVDGVATCTSTSTNWG